MIEGLDRGWRLVGTAISFSSFGIGGLLLRAIYFPMLGLLVRNPQSRTRRARLAIHHAFRSFVALMDGLGVLRYEVMGLEKLNRPGQLILSNHPTLIDVVFLISFVPNADCVVRSGLARNPFTRGPVNATGYICNDSGAELVEDCIRSIKAGNNLIIFPEGTRTPKDGQMKLQRGAANIAVRGGCDVTPVIIRCRPRTLGKGEPWWKIPPRRAEFSIEVLDDIPVAPFIEAANHDAPLAARRLTDHLYEFFTSKRASHAST
jgi:1-acyl-sn-glycerol-3-phosphate acyltransferase